jgi:hypothetical protein
MSFTHNPFNPRTNFDKKTGGQVEINQGEKHAGLKKSIEYMQEEYADLLLIKYLGIQGRSFMTRYRWPKLLECVTRIHGHRHLYEDSKGRSF